MLVEPRSIDDDRLDARTADGNRLSGRAPETRNAGFSQDEIARKIEFAEGVGADQARAVDRRSDTGVLFEHDHAVPAVRQAPMTTTSRLFPVRTCGRASPTCHGG